MRPAAFALAVLLATASLAGCLGRDAETPAADARRALVADPDDVWPLLSPHVDVEVLAEHAPVPSFDGTLLDAWVYRPGPEDAAPVPVIVNFSPYWGNAAPPAAERGDAFSQYLIDHFVPRGFAVVLTSVRGTGESAGCFNLGGATERRDAVAVIDAFAAAPWSTGAIAAGGKSYDGTTPQGAAIEGPAALKAIIPVSAISELYKYTYKGGLPYGGLHGATFNARYVAQVGWDVFDWPEDPSRIDSEDVCADFPVIAGAGVATAATGDYDAYWTERDYAPGAPEAAAAMFFIHGLSDWNVKPDHVLPWLGAYAGPKKVWLHQWVQPDDRGGEGGHVYPFREDWNYTMLRFLDHTLKGIDTGLFDEPAVQVQDSAGTWRHEDAWPPSSVAPLSFHLGAGRLAAEPGDGSPASFVDDGRTPEAPDPESPNQLVYRSDPLALPLRIAGEPVLHVTASSDRAAGKIGVTLWAEDASGARRILDWGGLNMRHRADPRTPAPVEPATPYALAVPMFPQDLIVPAGERLVLVIAGNAGFPGSGYMEFEEIPTGAAITIVEDATAALELPVEPEASVVAESPQPVEAPFCWAC